MNTFYSCTAAIVLIFSFLNTVRSTEVSKCEDGLLPEVEIANCEKQPCIFYISSNTSMTMKFNSPQYLEKFAPNAIAHIMGVKIPYPLAQNDGCVGLTNTLCPLDEGEYIEYTYSMFILPIFPEIIFSLEFSLVDKEQNNNLACFMVDIHTKKQS